MSHQRMYNEYFEPYKAAVDAGVGSVMASFNEVDGVPATANKWLLTDVLRKQWAVSYTHLDVYKRQVQGFPLEKIMCKHR